MQLFWMLGNIGEGGHRCCPRLTCSPHIATVSDVYWARWPTGV